MNTASMIFVIIDKLVSPSSSVNGDPLDDFPDHWQPRFPPSFSFARPPPNKDLSVLGCSSRVCCLARVTCKTRCLHRGGHQLAALRTAWVTVVFAGPTTGSSLSSFSALTQSSTSFPCPPR